MKRSFVAESNINRQKINPCVAKSFKIGSLPLIVIIGADGNILYHNSGADMEFDKNIRKILDQEVD